MIEHEHCKTELEIMDTKLDVIDMQNIKTKDHCGFIYVIKNLVNGKFYIGLKTFDRFNRWVYYLGSSEYLNEDILKYGHYNFARYIIDLATNSKELYEKETFYIKKFDARNNDMFYNTRRYFPKNEIEQQSINLYKKRDGKIVYLLDSNMNIIKKFNRIQFLYEYCKINFITDNNRTIIDYFLQGNYLYQLKYFLVLEDDYNNFKNSEKSIIQEKINVGLEKTTGIYLLNNSNISKTFPTKKDVLSYFHDTELSFGAKLLSKRLKTNEIFGSNNQVIFRKDYYKIINS